MGLEQSKKIYEILNDIVASNSYRPYRSNPEYDNDLENYDYMEGRKRHKAGQAVGDGLGSYNLKKNDNLLWDLASILAGAGTTAFFGPGWGTVAQKGIRSFGPKIVAKIRGDNPNRFRMNDDFERRREEDDFWEKFI